MNLQPNFPDPDGFYAALVFLVADPGGEQATLLACIDAARISLSGD